MYTECVLKLYIPPLEKILATAQSHILSYSLVTSFLSNIKIKFKSQSE